MPKQLKEQLVLYKTPIKTPVQPFLKWAGGKRQLIPFIKLYLPLHYNTYYEPFIGAGALLLHLQPHRAIINDVNLELINCYEVIRDQSLDLIEALKKHKNNKSYFYKIRELDRTAGFEKLSNVERAARIIYLNKTCFNGLFRVNKQGQFNVPFGNYKKPNIINSETIFSINRYLNSNEIGIMNSDFSIAVQNAQRNDFVYMDPPYDPVSLTASFTGYSLNQFGKVEQERLYNLFEDLTLRGCKVMLSNSSTPFIKNLYRDYNVISIPANRNINSDGSKRQKVEELLILNYNPEQNEY